MLPRNLFRLAVFSVLVPLASSAQNPRDTFWSANDLISVTPNPAAHHRSKSHTTAPHEAQAEVAPTSGSVNSPDHSRGGAVATLVALNGYGATPHLVRSSESRLGLRCSLLLRGADKEYGEIKPGTVFHSGDHIRLSLMANQAGYLYVIQKGSSGAWSPIYPPRNAGADAARISPGHLEIVPGGTQAFAFDQHAGEEKLYVILSREPVEDIDRVIRNLGHGGTPAPSAPPAPANDGSQVLEAANVIPDAFVQQLASRDLSLVDEQTVDSSSTSDQDGEKAVYVVAKQEGRQSPGQVVLSIDLNHE
jgi:hypothetical protein